MKLVFFCHAITSCWNNGNAHFLRGVTRALARRGHEVVVHEPEDGWSRLNAIRDGGERAIRQATALLRGIDIRRYRRDTLDLDAAVDHADAVIVHEWNEPWLVAALGERRRSGAPFRLLFHDTHHRAVTAPEQISADHLDGFDAALVFGAALREVYRARDLAPQVFVWHEAADTELFQPMRSVAKECDLIWIGNWGDEERTAELHDFLIAPVARLGLAARLHGVRYPDAAQQQLRARGLDYRGWLPNHCAPLAFARARTTVHIPRGPYARALPGIPTIRVFEALACGIPLISAPWDDCERLFPAGSYLAARSSAAMTEALADVLNDPALATDLANRGVRVIHQAHTCGHRAEELIDIVAQLSAPPAATRVQPLSMQAAT
jgi:spore maturation protein CgeB